VVFELGLCGAELSQVIAPDFFDLLAGDVDPIFAEVVLANTFCEIAGFFNWTKHTGLSKAVVTPYFLFAHLFFCATAILARPSALIVRRFFVALSGAVWPVSNARAFSRRLIYALMPCTIGDVHAGDHRR
jgi:hypothetical protein